MVILGGLFLGSSIIWWGLNSLSISRYSLTSSKLNSTHSIRVIHLSDLHAKSFGHQNRRLIKKIQKLKPDLIVTTGDMINSTDTDGEAFLQIARACAKQYPVFYVEGNHEMTARFDEANQTTKWYHHYLAELQALGVHVLNNESYKINLYGEAVYVYGLNVPLGNYYAIPESIKAQLKVDKLTDVSELLPPLNESALNMLLAHNPFLAPLYEKHGFDYVYCGHVHGGMIRLPMLGGLLSPERKLFPKYDEGVYSINQMKLIVSRGLGRFRLFNRPEIVVVDVMSPTIS